MELPQHLQGTILIARGFVYGGMGRYRDALTAFCEALERVDHKEDPSAAPIIIHNIVVAISLDEHTDHATLQQVLHKLDSVRKGLGRRSEGLRLRLKWAEALVDLRFGINNRALNSLVAVRRAFRRMHRPSMEFAMVSIDLAQAYIEVGDPVKCLEQLRTALSELQGIESLEPSACEELTECIGSLADKQFEIGMLYLARQGFLKPKKDRQALQTAQYPGD